MNAQPLKHTSAFISFSYASFLVSLTMLGGGVMFLPIDLWMKGFLVMGIAMMVQSCIVLTKTLRDNQEADKLLSRIEDARTERLLMDVAKGQ